MVGKKAHLHTFVKVSVYKLRFSFKEALSHIVAGLADYIPKWMCWCLGSPLIHSKRIHCVCVCIHGLGHEQAGEHKVIIN